ncbi:response regulator [Pontibacillus sp. ALD_SL1]|uniref:response regulator n=1 Tax=Pontibacillus sp. ALD_SL1 TaxID=2777185 RepID=UPI001A96B92B|nr:response regulator [Pontibacillus sp. ALD_SL1]QSS99586.1 response regulator [Pontibacillus sp. ALD_SL1]
MKRILIADDEEVLRMLIVDTLEEEGYELEEAEDGIEAFEKVQENEYDLLILDYMMPGMTGMTGIEVAERIKALNGKERMKIMMLTAKNQQKDVDASKAAGIHYYMAKPFSPLQLIELVEDILDA